MSKVYDKRDGISLAKLHLDSDNPRHDHIADEDTIIAHLFKEEKVLSLAKSIAKMGINPLESIGVIEMPDNPGHYIVAEGNRRACALKVLHDPKKAPTAAARRVLEPYKLSGNVRYSVVVFRDRASARPFLEIRHLGGQDGVGVKAWDAEQKVRFADGSSPNTMALEVLDRAALAGWIDADARAKISVTTVQRYLGNPVVRTALGLGERGALTFTHEPSEVDVALKQFILDAVPHQDGTQAPVNSRTNAKDWKAYGKSLHDRGLTPKTELPAPTKPPAPVKEAETKSRGPRHPDSRATVIPKSFVLTYRDPALQRLVRELKELPADDYVFAANYLLRAVIERVMVLYAQKMGRHRPKMDDRALTRACNEALEADGVPPASLKNLRIAASNDDATVSLQTLGASVHGAHLPTRVGLIAVWENWVGPLELMLRRL